MDLSTYVKRQLPENDVVSNRWLVGEENLPSFPKDVYKHLPTFIDRVIKEAISFDDVDTLLLGTLSVLSATLPMARGVYDGRTVFSNLYMFLVADAGIGKGTLSLCRELVQPIHDRLRGIAREMAEGKVTGKGKEAPQLALIIPGNSTSSALIRTLSDNFGEGLLFESEVDSISRMLKTEFGNYSDVLRKAFHHESVSLCRRKNREFLELECPKLSVALAGTPAQIRSLIPDVENGLFSRFCFYHIKFEMGIRDVFSIKYPRLSKTETFHKLGVQYKELIRELYRKGETFEITIPSPLKCPFVDHYDILNNEVCDTIGEGMQAVVRRNALIAYRIMMILTMIRYLTHATCSSSNKNQPVMLEISYEDYDTAMAIAETLLIHSAFEYRILARTCFNPQRHERIDRRKILFDKLPDRFSKKDFLVVVRELNYAVNKCTKWIAYFIANGFMTQQGEDEYVKTKNSIGSFEGSDMETKTSLNEINENEAMLFFFLPDEFTTADVLKKAEEFGLSRRTAFGMLRNLATLTYPLIVKNRHGRYHKVRKTDNHYC